MNSKTFSEGIPLGKIAGTPIVLAYSWFIIAAFIVITWGPTLMDAFPDLGAAAFALAFAYALLLLFSVLVHELAHALVARAFKWPSTKIVLNLWGGHTQFDNFTVSAGRSLVVALSGPLANFILAGIGYLLQPLTQPGTPGSALMYIFTLTNFLVAVFNVLPGLPLDGGRIVETIVWKATGNQDKGTIAAGWTGRIIAVGIAIVAVGLPWLRQERPQVSYILITLLICGFLWMGASSAIKSATIRSRLPGISAGKLMRPAIPMLDTATVATIEQGVPQPGQQEVILQNASGTPIAIVDWQAATSVPANQRASTPATSVSRAIDPEAIVPEWAQGNELVTYMNTRGGTQFVVVNTQGNIVGLLDQQALIRAVTGKATP
ncbi:site-2 protease family protein [Haematomicrobium sanguinis]|uniref:site-2 protease family protein n=1 Tax=Haematomicrobium sanguinis TaxID=479106 RepID=UPI00047B583F|nr:site-2 protease family protein [Haematomicrobium sanguinis]